MSGADLYTLLTVWAKTPIFAPAPHPAIDDDAGPDANAAQAPTRIGKLLAGAGAERGGAAAGAPAKDNVLIRP